MWWVTHNEEYVMGPFSSLEAAETYIAKAVDFRLQGKIGCKDSWVALRDEYGVVQL